MSAAAAPAEESEDGGGNCDADGYACYGAGGEKVVDEGGGVGGGGHTGFFPRGYLLSFCLPLPLSVDLCVFPSIYGYGGKAHPLDMKSRIGFNRNPPPAPG